MPIPDEVKKAYPERDFIFGPEYIIPTYFDPRLIYILPVAIAKAAADSGVA
jgi:malate dehydrogenase (oxaloacetate-decarboxylating)(NADP+)